MKATCARAGGLAGLPPESVPAASGVSKTDTAPRPLCLLPEASVTVGLGILEACFVLGRPRFFPLPGLSQMVFGVWLPLQLAGE